MPVGVLTCSGLAAWKVEKMFHGVPKSGVVLLKHVDASIGVEVVNCFLPLIFVPVFGRCA